MKMQVTEEQKEELEALIEFGDKLEAVRYAQKNFGLDAEQAVTMVERLEQQLEAESDAELERAGKEVERSTANLPGIVGGIFGIIGFILIALAAYFGYRSYTFLENAVVIPGIVKEFVEREYQDNNRDSDTYGTKYKMFAPILEYHYEGKDYTYESPYGSSTPEYAVGDQVSLQIDPSEPGKAEENSFMSNWFVPMLLGSIGLVFAGVGIVVRKAFSRS